MDRARRVARRAVLAFCALIVVVGAGAAADLLSIRGDLDEGRQTLDSLDLDRLRANGLEGTLADAADHLAAAHDRAESSPFLRIVGVIPFVDDQVDAIRDLTAAADELGTEARVTGERISTALDGASADPAARIDLIDVVVDEVERVINVAADIDVGATGRLVPPLRSARSSVVDSLDSAPERLGRVRDQATVLRDLLSGPTLYLVNVGNNAEMRAGAGMPLSIGLAGFTDGDIALSEFKAATSELFTDDPTGPFNSNIPEPLQDTYPRWAIGRDFPETAVVPDFDVTGPIYADLSVDTQGIPVEGVIHIDVIALTELLAVVGPVEVGGVEYDAENAPQLLLNQAYLDFDGVSRRFRRDAQSDLAQALFDAIKTRDLDLLDVADALQTAAEGRHLMLWSRDPVLEDLFTSFGASGTIAPFQTLVSLQNTAANKLDWYIEPAVTVVTEPVGDEWVVTLTTSVVHPDRELTVPYIEGPIESLAGGTHRALLTVQVPRAATGLDMPGEDVTEFGDDGSSLVIGTRFTIPRGETRDVVTTYRLPRDAGAIVVAPSARVRPVPWTVNGIPFSDDRGFFASFGPFPDVPPDNGWQQLALAGVIVGVAGAGTMVRGARRDPTERGIALARLDTFTGAVLLAFATGFCVVAVVLASR